MAKPQKKTDISPKTREDSLQVAKATQRPGQTKEQTKLIAQGIQKGIEQYKKQQKSKSRELDKQLKKVQKQSQQSTPETEIEIQEVVKLKQSWFPWILLILSWAGIGAYLINV